MKRNEMLFLLKEAIALTENHWDGKAKNIISNLHERLQKEKIQDESMDDKT